MELGDRIIVYTHEASDIEHKAVDYLAFVVGIVDDVTVDVIIFPPGGPLRFERVSLYDPENPYNVPGDTYWRPVGEEPPTFEELHFSHEPEWAAMVNRHRRELADRPTKEHPKLVEKHKKERDELHAKFAAEHKEPVE